MKRFTAGPWKTAVNMNGKWCVTNETLKVIAIAAERGAQNDIALMAASLEMVDYIGDVVSYLIAMRPYIEGTFNSSGMEMLNGAIAKGQGLLKKIDEQTSVRLPPS